MEDYICYDGKIESSEEIDKMSKEQKEIKFQQLFGKYLDDGYEKTKAISKLMGKLATGEKSADSDGWLSNDDVRNTLDFDDMPFEK